MDYDTLAKAHAEIWWHHDSKKYSKIDTFARVFLALRGTPPKKAAKAAAQIRLSYYFYDLAEKYPPKKNFYFSKVCKSHINVMSELVLEKNLGILYEKWWKAFMNRDYPAITYYLFLYHYVGFKEIRKVFSPFATFLIVLAGYLGHNKRNKGAAIYFLASYWKFIDFLGIRNFIIY